ncbi:hypothetical protein FOVG_18087 [Fusarium oxysporum f. sp. pisi HDV247]|uniref:Major facilitator superfamily (MFS) profile domain-containing protein n=1 Tax=Fusarium oxysporum f. sp. pisi HDV247 TaxID=1080344 RepID=W9NKM1_FUSOX|nr:hypothetical protein FOVG_18087 [Fusarium oxysporum f. sp. pisi HDV247]
MLFGALFLGTLADNIGRRLVWQLSIFGCSIVTTIAACSPNWTALNIFIVLIGLFSGGNLAIDLTILAEAMPQEWSFILSSLAGTWGLGNAITGLISCGRMQEAADMINNISKGNKSGYHITEAHFMPINPAEPDSKARSWRANCRRTAKLFSGAKKFRLMAGLIVIWALIGIAYPLYTIFLPYYLAANGANFGEQSDDITMVSLSAPFIATFSDVTTSAPIWVACASFLAIGVIAMVLPVDTMPCAPQTAGDNTA